jgi:hypothetical protein
MGLTSICCGRCGSKEHATDDCPHEFFSTKCERCGSVDHAAGDCPRGFFSAECGRCGSKEHATDDCPHEFFSTKCERCGSVDHAAEDCPRGFFSNECARCGSKNHNVEHCPHRLSAPATLKYPSSTGDDNSGTNIIVKIVVGGLILFAILWFVFAVAIPLLMIDIAAIALIAALIRKDSSKWLLPLSAGGAVLLLADYNLGWSTKSLATNVSFLAGLIPILLYINVLAGLIAAYFLIRNFMNARNPHPEHAGELTRRNAIAMGCLLTVGCLIFGLQTAVDSNRRQARQSAAAANLVSSSGTVTKSVGANQVPVSATNGFVGTWQYTDSQGDTRYLRIGKLPRGQFQLFEGWPGEQGAINWSQDGYYLALAKGKLTANIQSGNFRATHGAVFEYQLTVEMIDDNSLLYTVNSDLSNSNDAKKASRIAEPINASDGSGKSSEKPGGTQSDTNQATTSGNLAGPKPSFNCSKATTPTELLICRDGDLASAEFQMAALRNQIASQLSGSEAAAFRTEHLDWFKNWSRTCNAIGKSQPETELRACIAQFLSSRTQQLKARIR